MLTRHAGRAIAITPEARGRARPDRQTIQQRRFFPPLQRPIMFIMFGLRGLRRSRVRLVFSA